MRRILFVLTICLLTGITASAQERMNPEETWKSEEVSGSNYHGFAFHKDWEVDVSIADQQGRFSPTDADIAQGEALMQKRIAYENRNHENQSGMCPVIDENLRQYQRQYVGFVDEHGYRVLWINGVWDDKAAPRLSHDLLLTEGGCGHYWHILVNLDTEKVYGLEVNAAGNVKYLPRVKRPGPRISKPRNENTPKRIRKTGIIHKNSDKVF